MEQKKRVERRQAKRRQRCQGAGREMMHEQQQSGVRGGYADHELYLVLFGI